MFSGKLFVYKIFHFRSLSSSVIYNFDVFYANELSVNLKAYSCYSRAFVMF